MKKILLFLALLSFNTNAYAADPCGSLLCLAGKLAGQSGGSACSGYLSSYFSIIVYKKHWRFNPGATAAARANFLNQCNNPGNDLLKSQIGSAYGMLQWMP